MKEHTAYIYYTSGEKHGFTAVFHSGPQGYFSSAAVSIKELFSPA